MYPVGEHSAESAPVSRPRSLGGFVPRCKKGWVMVTRVRLRITTEMSGAPEPRLDSWISVLFLKVGWARFLPKKYSLLLYFSVSRSRTWSISRH